MYHTLVLVGVGCLFSLLAAVFQPFYSMNLWLSDQLFMAERAPPNIVIGGIDDATLETYGRLSEWPRRLHAQAIDNLSEAGAKVIGLDILFVDSSPDDQILATAMENANNVVLVAAGTEPLPMTESEITFDRFLLPVFPLEQVSTNIGHANVVPDPDSSVRRLPLVIRDSAGQIYPAFSVAMLHTLFSMPLPQEYVLQGGALNLLARDISVDEHYRLRINFAADTASSPYISYCDVISGDFDHSLVKNKIVVIGMTATGEVDTWAIPTSASKIPGVFIHTAAMDTILRQRFLVEKGIGFTVMAMLLLVGIAAFTLPRCGTRRWTDLVKGGGITAGLFVAYLVAGFLAFDKGYILDMLYPLIIAPLLYVSSVLSVIVIEQSDKQFVKELFGRYVSPEVAWEIINSADAGELQLGGEERDATVLFADIRHFTRISEQMSPKAIVNMLNTYLSVVIDSILQNKGMINKFAGDNVMAVWNAPQPQSEHARLAVKAAWEAQQKLSELQQSDASLPQMQFGIGINTGKVLAGNVGSWGRVEYTVIGDTVNLASRICGVTLGSEVWIGSETYHQTIDHIDVVKLESQSFKGKAERVVVYKVIGWH
ncbi:CHASE2 domain-containing protein [Chloroflexota bacterium]